MVMVCVVPGCVDPSKPLHRFPRKEKHVFLEWIRRIQSPKLENCTDLQIYKKYYVCSKHFTKFNMEVPPRLLYCSVPTIGVPGFDGPPTKENSFLYNSSSPEEECVTCLKTIPKQIECVSKGDDMSIIMDVLLTDEVKTETISTSVFTDHTVNNEVPMEIGCNDQTSQNYSEDINEESIQSIPATNPTDLSDNYTIHPDFENVCRFCAKADEIEMFEIFTKPNMETKIKLCYPFIAVAKDDGLPQKLCKQCFQTLQLTYKSLENIAASEKLFRNISQLKQSSIKNAVELVYELKAVETPPDKETNDVLCVKLVIEKLEHKFHCPFCVEDFVIKGDLKRHISKHFVKHRSHDEYKHRKSRSVNDKKIQCEVTDQQKSTDDDDSDKDSLTDEHFSDSSFKSSVSDLSTEESTNSMDYDYTEKSSVIRTTHDNIPEEDSIVTNDEKSLRTCSICGKVLSSRRKKLIHENGHTRTFLHCPVCCVNIISTDLVCCVKCDNEIASRRKLVVVQTQYDTLYRCPNCWEIFISADKMVKHFVSSHHGVLQNKAMEPRLLRVLFQCEHCCRPYSKLKALLTHRESCEFLNHSMYACYCSEVFKRFGIFHLHMLSHEKDTSNMSPYLKRPKCKLYFHCKFCYMPFMDIFTHYRHCHPVELYEGNKPFNNIKNFAIGLL